MVDCRWNLKSAHNIFEGVCGFQCSSKLADLWWFLLNLNGNMFMDFFLVFQWFDFMNCDQRHVLCLCQPPTELLGQHPMFFNSWQFLERWKGNTTKLNWSFEQYWKWPNNTKTMINYTELWATPCLQRRCNNTLKLLWMENISQNNTEPQSVCSVLYCFVVFLYFFLFCFDV